MVLERCLTCRNVGIWILPSGTVSICPALQSGREHPPIGEAAQILTRCVNRVVREGKAVNAHLFDLAVRLCAGTTSAPVERQLLLDKHFSFTSNKLRQFHHAIEELRRSWALPVGSRKDTPAGYWIITDGADFREWVERSKAAPVKQLSTIHHVAKLNFPLYAEQLELEFWGEVRASGSLAAA